MSSHYSHYPLIFGLDFNTYIQVTNMTYIKSLITLFILQLSLISYAQDFSEVNYPMTAFGSDLDFGFLGGLINPQFSNIDFNGDGNMDLFVFDRNGNRPYAFLHKGGIGVVDYEHAPQYENVFPAELHDWVLLVDYDGDGIQDIFGAPPSNNNGVAVWKGSVTDGVWSFDQQMFGDADPNTLYCDYPTASGTQRRQIYVAMNTDVPAILDMDGDGDIDILSFEDGGSYIVLYENLAADQDIGLDRLVFGIGETCWGKVKEGGLDATIEMNADMSTIPINAPCLLFTMFQDDEPLASERHSGSTVTAFDGDGDGDMDVVLGDIGTSTFVYLQNGGDVELARVDEIIEKYPQSEGGVNQYINPAAFYVDVDNDGNRDFVSCSIAKESGININHIWYYHNTNTDASPVFVLDRKNLLMDETINIGRYTTPTFIDYNADGLTDILVGSSGYRISGTTSSIGLHLFENVGTESEPAFELVDDDFLSFSSLLEFSSRLAPAFGDLDGDGDQDLIVCDGSSGPNNGDLFYFENIAGVNQPIEFNGYISEYMDLDPGFNLIPQIVDLNQDGLNDIVLGENNAVGSNGSFRAVNYFQNIGTETEPMFNEDQDASPNSNGIIPLENNTIRAITPYFYQAENELLLFTGMDSGQIRVWDNYNQDTQLFTSKNDHLGNLNIGRNTVPAVYDIDNDGFLELLIGNRRGGLDFYNTSFSVEGLDTGVEDDFVVEATIYPNPTTGAFQIMTTETLNTVILYDITGRPLKTWKGDDSFYQMEDLHSGTYLVKIATTDGRNAIYKLVLTK